MATATLQANRLDRLRMHRISVEQYHQMIEKGVLREGAPVELLEGLLVTKMARTPSHDGTISRLNRFFSRVLTDAWDVRVQCALTTDDSEPEPDLLIAVASDEDYTSRHPYPEDTALVIEVALTTLEEDRDWKGRIYARAKIPYYWIVNLKDRQIEEYTNPRGGRSPRFQQLRILKPGQSISVVLLGKETVKLQVKDLFRGS